MKHCLNCYRKLPNDSAVCHYCGAPQAEKGAPAANKVLRCPNCLSYLYTEQFGCQKCGFIRAEKKNRALTIIPTIILAILAVFVIWQLGYVPFLPSPGKLTASMRSKNAATAIPSEVAAMDLVPIETDEPALLSPIAATPTGATEITITATPGNTATVIEPSATKTVMGTVEETVKAPDEEKADVVVATQTAATTQTAEPTTTATPDQRIQCGELFHIFEPGDLGELGPVSTSIKVRSKPATSGELLSIFRVGMTFEVLPDEPVCDNTYLWVKIRILDEDIEGWTVEADHRYYWVQPKREE